jgi:hypothetical protein
MSKNTTTAFLMMNDDYRQMHGVRAQLPVLATKKRGVADMVKYRIDTATADEDLAERLDEPASY